MQNSPTGANTNRKLGKSWAHIRDSHIRTACKRDTPCPPVHRKIKREVYTKMNEKENKNRRDLYLKIRVSREELDAIDRKFRNSGMKSRSEFVRAMIFEGYIVQFNEEKMSEILRLARNISGNINQIAVRANSGGRVYDDDIAEIKEGVNKLWQPLRYFQSLLMTLQH